MNTAQINGSQINGSAVIISVGDATMFSAIAAVQYENRTVYLLRPVTAMHGRKPSASTEPLTKQGNVQNVDS